MYASMPDTVTSVMRSAHRDGFRHLNSNYSRENQHNTSSGPQTGKGKTPEAPPLKGDPEEGLEK
ncbi:hypothetical protein E2C01_040120 [Portunus trituberculatus]|uniref:Uncharacterized protein n=1 Tax=Portunus trituberculatus TaxID=210409 RepID=A0A5B7FMF6_PORTR|nr:hypothetical protein [Portunus trituberculatus]